VVVVIVVRLVSATRRPTVHWAHHDRGSAASMWSWCGWCPRHAVRPCA